jgi:hypothetical protein
VTAWLLWQWAICPAWAKCGFALLLLAVGLQLVDILVSSWKGVAFAAILLLLLALALAACATVERARPWPFPLETEWLL